MAKILEMNGKGLAEALNDCKQELKGFASTRFEMLRAEMKEKVAGLKTALPALAIGGVLLLTSFFLFTGGLVYLVALIFAPAPYAYAAAFFCVFALYALIGGACLAYGMRSLKARGLVPQRTLKILKDDQVWLQTEARSQL